MKEEPKDRREGGDERRSVPDRRRRDRRVVDVPVEVDRRGGQDRRRGSDRRKRR